MKLIQKPIWKIRQMTAKALLSEIFDEYMRYKKKPSAERLIYYNRLVEIYNFKRESDVIKKLPSQ